MGLNPSDALFGKRYACSLNIWRLVMRIHRNTKAKNATLMRSSILVLAFKDVKFSSFAESKWTNCVRLEPPGIIGRKSLCNKWHTPLGWEIAVRQYWNLAFWAFRVNSSTSFWINPDAFLSLKIGTKRPAWVIRKRRTISLLWQLSRAQSTAISGQCSTITKWPSSRQGSYNDLSTDWLRQSNAERHAT